MIKNIFIALIALGLSSTQASDHDLLAKLVIDSDAGIISSAVTQTSNANGSFSYRLTVECFNKCSFGKYQELLNDTPLGIFRVSDINDNIITTWVSGSAYHVRIYGINAKEISKIFDRPSLGAPEFIRDENGNESIKIYLKTNENSDVIEPQIWFFDGVAFRLKPGGK